MSECINCLSSRLVKVDTKCGENFLIEAPNSPGREYMGYVDPVLGIGMGKSVQFEYCLQCGMIQNTFPRNFNNVLENNFKQPAWQVKKAEESKDEEKECGLCGFSDCLGGCDCCDICGERDCYGDCDYEEEEEEEEEEDDPEEDEEYEDEEDE